MNCSYENEENQRKLTKYKNIIKYAFSSLHNYLQTLPIKGASENIKDNNNNYEMQKDNYLFCELQSCEAGKYRFNHMYAFEKLSFLYLNKRYMDMAQILVNEIKDYWEPYVQFDSYMSADEICILLHIASYFWRLDNDSDFEKNIPNTNDYR